MSYAEFAGWCEYFDTQGKEPEINLGDAEPEQLKGLFG